MFFACLLPALLAARVTAAPQNINFPSLDAVKQGPVTIPIGVTAQVVTYNPTSAASSVVAAVTNNPKGVKARSRKIKSFFERPPAACAAYPASCYTGPTPADNAADFLAFPAFAKAAKSAPVPAGYVKTFTNLRSSSSALGYLGFTELATYDVHGCAAKCSATTGCMAINIFYERSPTLKTDTACPKPPSMTVVKCVLWGGPVNSDNALNSGQRCNNFQVVQTGSNGYVVSGSVATPPSYSSPTCVGNASINAPVDCNGVNTFLGSKIFTGTPFDPALCSAACDATSTYNIAKPPATGSPQTCQFFNTYILYLNGVAQGQMCAMYSKSWDSTYAVNIGYHKGSDIYSIGFSYTFSNAANPVHANACVPGEPSTPSTAPFSVTPSTTPVLVIPSTSPLAGTPSTSPVSVTPSTSPVQFTLSTSLLTVTPSTSPTTVTPSSTPIPVTPSTSPISVTPSTSPVQFTLSTSLVSVTPSTSPVQFTLSTSILTVTPSTSPPSVTPSTPIPVTPSTSPVPVTPSSAPLLVTPSTSPLSVTPSTTPISVTPSTSPLAVTPSTTLIPVTLSSSPLAVTTSTTSPSVTISVTPSTTLLPVTPSTTPLAVTPSTTPLPVTPSTTPLPVTSSTTPLPVTPSTTPLPVTSSTSPLAVTPSTTPLPVTPSTTPLAVTTSTTSPSVTISVMPSTTPLPVTSSTSPLAVTPSTTLIPVTPSTTPLAVTTSTTSPSVTISVTPSTTPLPVTSSTSPLAVTPSTTPLPVTPSTTPLPVTSSTISLSATPSGKSYNGYDHVGCYTDHIPARGLLGPEHESWSSMTLEFCSEYCTGYTYFSVEDGANCKCGNVLQSASQPAPSTSCNMPCTGNSAETCGGFFFMNLYKNHNPGPAPLVNGLYAYQGCYTDGISQRGLQGPVAIGAKITLEYCATFCQGFPYFGVENANSCFCGNTLEGSSVTDPTNSNCNYQCSGNSNQTCGGFCGMNVYVNPTALATKPTTIDGYTYQGCYTDSPIRTLGNVAQYGVPNLTYEYCANWCNASGYKYFGVEFGVECYCSDYILPSAVMVADNTPGTCNYKCDGNSSDTCGGFYYISIFGKDNLISSPGNPGTWTIT